MRYDRLKHVSITFINEKNTTPKTQLLTKIQFADVSKKEIYSELLTLYEVNLNRINDSNAPSENLLVLTSFLSLTCHKDLCDFVNRFDSDFARRLIIGYFYAVTDDALLLKIEGSEKFMFELTAERIQEEREEAREEGREEGREQNIIEVARKMLANGLAIDLVAACVDKPVEWLKFQLALA